MSVIIGHIVRLESERMTQGSALTLYEELSGLSERHPELSVDLLMVYADGSEMGYRPEQLRPAIPRCEVIAAKIAEMKLRTQQRQAAEKLRISKLPRRLKKAAKLAAAR